MSDAADSDARVGGARSRTGAGSGRRSAPRRRRRVGIAVAIVVVLLAGITARVFVWPSLARLPQHADAIVELAGPGDAGRDAVALTLAREHRADYLVQSTRPGDDHCLPVPSGVKLLCFHPDPETTQGEAQWIGATARARNWKSVILVTTPDQAFRAKLRTDRCFPGRVYVATSTLPWKKWFMQIPYQWGASIKAVVWQRAC